MQEIELSTVWNAADVDGAFPTRGGMITSNNTTSLADIQFVFNNPAKSASRVAIIVSYLLTFVAGVAGNSLVLYIIVAHRQLRLKSVANCYIGNLAVADLSFVATLPLFCWNTFTSDWPFGDAACKLAFSVHDGVRFVGVFTLVALSVDRYMASYYDLGRYRTTVAVSYTHLTLPTNREV